MPMTRAFVLILAALSCSLVAAASRDHFLAAFEPAGDDAGERFVWRGPGSVLLVAPTEAVFAIAPGSHVSIGLLGADEGAPVSGEGELPGRSHYYVGRGAEPRWRTDVPRFAAARVTAAWPGIDVLYYGRDDGAIEFDFEVAAGADPGIIRLVFSGADSIRTEDGGLLLRRGSDSVRIGRPLAYQEGLPIGARFVLDDGCVAAVDLGAWDARRALVIDPLLGYSSYLGGTAFEISRAVGSDAAGNIYVVGETNSPDFPLMNPYQPGFAGGSWDLFVAKLDPTGSTLLFATYLGGSGAERACLPVRRRAARSA